MLVRELPDFMRTMTTAFTENNLAALEESAHKLHGATSYCDVPDLKQAIQALERAARNRDHGNIENFLNTVRQQVDLILQRVAVEGSEKSQQVKPTTP